ncbi:MAG: histidine utilization repressor [Holophagales bacterium]|nr:histidine utilization repressor [Holophagales bacterium]
MSRSLDAARPLYRQIKDRILERIETGDWPPGRKIPSENEIVQQLGVSRMTVHRALRELAQEGYLLRVAGVGTFVAEPPPRASLVELRDIAEEVRNGGGEHSARVLCQAKVELPPAVVERMERRVGAIAFHLVLVHHRNGLPIQHEERWIGEEMLPDALELDFSRATPSEVLLERVVAHEMEHIVRAVSPTPELCQRLAIAASEPCLCLERRTWNRGRVVTYAVLTHPGSRHGLGARYSLGSDSHREPPEIRPVPEPPWRGGRP